MKANIGHKHQVVIKIVKQLDDLMIRNPSIEQEQATEEMYPEPEIPMPSSCFMDMGVSMSGFS